MHYADLEIAAYKAKLLRKTVGIILLSLCVIAVLTVAGFVFYTFALHHPSPKQPEKDLVFHYSFYEPEAYGEMTAPAYLENSDLVARVRIERWLQEDNSDPEYPVSYYEAHVELVYKGDQWLRDTEIVLQQLGSSRARQMGVPLYDVGNTLLVFTEEKSDTAGYPVVYAPRGRARGVFDIVDVGSKDHPLEFAVKVFCPFTDEGLQAKQITKDSHLYSAILSPLYTQFHLSNSMNVSPWERLYYNQVFYLQDLEYYIADVLEGKK